MSTRRCYIPNIKALGLPVSEKKNFEDGLLCSYVPSCDPRGGAIFDPRGIIWINVVEVHKEILHTKNESSTPSISEKKNFEDGLLCSYVPTFDPLPPGMGPVLNPYEQTWFGSIKRHHISNNQSSRPYSFREEEF